MAGTKTVTISEFLYIRLRQLGVRALHGLPGDFNLIALDYVESCGLKWVGNCNELNAGYAADAYGRVRGMGAIMTTFGVGELSAINAIAGAFAEFVPVVKIVGTPATASQREGALLHHTLGNGNFRVFADIYSHVTIAQADLNNPMTAGAEIDRVLRECYIQSRPVYVMIPSDMAAKPIDALPLETPIDVSTPQSDPAAEDRVVELILHKFYAARRPTILVDAGVDRHRLREETEELLTMTGLPFVNTPMGKGAVDESLPNYLGVYVGSGANPAIADAIENSDFVLTIGNVKSDLNTVGFSYRISRLNSVDLHFDNTIMDYAKYEGVYMKWILRRIVASLDKRRLSPSAFHLPKIPPMVNGINDFGEESITHAWLWPRLSSWLRKGDVVITEAGTSIVGIWETRFPAGVNALCQTLWSSIGYGVGAAQGAALAAQEEGKGARTIAFEGDGSFQLTCQEISTILRHNLKVTMFLIENDGYTIERWVHGMNAEYNDIPQWRYSEIPRTMLPEGEDGKGKLKIWKIKTRSELEALLEDAAFADGEGLQFVEMHMPREDAPKALIDFLQKGKKGKVETVEPVIEAVEG